MMTDYTTELSSNCICEEEDYRDRGCDGWACYQPIKDDFEENIFPEFLARNNNPLFVKITGKAMGWQRLTGHAIIPADFDRLFDALTINGDWTLRIKLEGNVLTVVRSSHDEPTGATFTIEPSTEEEAA
jgi:hypothetical protein